MRVLSIPLTFLLYLISLLPLRLLYLLSDVLFVFFYYWPGYRKSVVRHNLNIAFGDHDHIEIEKITRDFYRNFCDLIVEFLKIPTISEKLLSRRVRFTNFSLLQQLTGSHPGVVGISSHMYNWEWGGLALSAAARNHDCLGVYKPLSNKTFDAWFLKIRSRFGMIMVPMKSTYRAVSKQRTKPFLLNLIADQTPTKSETEYTAQFLGHPTPVFLGPEKIAGNKNIPAVYYAMRKIRRGYYEVTLIPVQTGDAPHALTNEHLRLLEEEIKLNPSGWLWTHRRWKHTTNY